MSEWEEFKRHLPYQLSVEPGESLLNNLQQFPENIDSRFYTPTPSSEEALFQGDGIKEMMLVRLPELAPKFGNCLVLSNTCDMSAENRRAMPSQITYAPMVRFDRFEQLIRGSGAYSDPASYLESVRKQRVSSAFFLPIGGGLEYEAVVLLDQIHSCDVDYVLSRGLDGYRILSLSLYGFYVLLFKLSVHFTRIGNSAYGNA